MITFFFRKKTASQNSIETLFEGIKDIVSEHEEVTSYEVPEKSASPLSIWRNIKQARSNKDVINHVTGDIHYVALGLGRNTILTIHDVGSGLRGNFFKRWYFKIFWLYIPATSVRAITVISEASKKELVKLIPFAVAKIEVIPNPYRRELLKFNKPYRNIKGVPNVLIVGTKINKNIERCFEALRGLKARVIVLGKLSQQQWQIAGCYQLDLVERYSLSYEAVIQTYTESDILCFPSTYEGFGMPIVEAQVLGVPVITSNYGAMKEVAGEGAAFVNPYKTEDLSKAIKRVLEDDDYRRGILEKGFENSKRFHPDRIVAQYRRLYDRMLKSR